MKASELRIGNYVAVFRKPTDEEKTFLKVVAIDLENVELEDGFLVNHNTGITSIPLTEEWLLKFGFEDEDKTFVKRYSRYEDENKSFISLYLDEKQNRWVAWVGNDNTPHGIAVNSYTEVHQLQNLFFSLTGEELTIK